MHLSAYGCTTETFTLVQERDALISCGMTPIRKLLVIFRFTQLLYCTLHATRHFSESAVIVHAALWDTEQSWQCSLATVIWSYLVLDSHQVHDVPGYARQTGASRDHQWSPVQFEYVIWQWTVQNHTSVWATHTFILQSNGVLHIEPSYSSFT